MEEERLPTICCGLTTFSPSDREQHPKVAVSQPFPTSAFIAVLHSGGWLHLQSPYC